MVDLVYGDVLRLLSAQITEYSDKPTVERLHWLLRLLCTSNAIEVEISVL